MNPKLNAWLCKRFDREYIKTDDFYNETTIPKKGYVTLWDIIRIGILVPFFNLLLVAVIVFIALAFPNIFVPSHSTTYFNSEFWTFMVYGVGFWIVIGLLYLVYIILAWIVSYKVAVCPLAEKKSKENSKEYEEDIPDSEKEKRKFLKEAEEKMFADILKDEK